MRMGLVKYKSIAPLLIAASLVAAPGCKSGWKMPSPSSMWPWNRQPSAETLAGTPTRPTVESPAPKHTPSTIASVAAGTTNKSASATPAGATGYPTTSLASTPVRPGYGGSAAANGYQTGPYGMSGQNVAQAPTTTYPGANGAGQLPPNTYQGLAGLPSQTMPPAGTPNVGNPYAPQVNAPLAQSGSTSGAQPGATNPYSMPNAAPQAGSSMPQFQPNLPAPATSYSTVSLPGTPYSASAGGLPPSSYPTGPSMPAVPPIPGASSGGAPAVPQMSSPQLPPSPAGTSMAAPAPTGGDAYRPGSTGRTNNPYNFSTGNATVPVNSGSYVPTQPGTGSGYGSFNLPPNTANAGNLPVTR